MSFLVLAYDDGFDGVAKASRSLAPTRWVTAVVVAGLVAATLGQGVAIIWALALGLAEIWTWLATTPHVRGVELSGRHRILYLASAVFGNSVWLGLSLAYWFAPPPAGPFVALLIWASLMLNAVSHAFRSPSALLLFSAPTATAMVAIPTFAPRFEGAFQLLAVVGLIVCACYAAISARRNIVAAQDLAAARRELEAQTQAALDANRAKSAFLALMSHELRTPMNGVLGMAHALERTELQPQQAEYLQTLLRSGGGLMTVLNDILDLAKIEAGRFDVDPHPFSLPEKMAKVVGLWAPLAEEKGLSLVCEIAPDAPTWVNGDGARLRQILQNLISNAVKFTAVGEVRVTVAPRGGQIVFTVTDTGPGMDEATQARLFQGFTQADSSVARRFGGTGLGLAISRELARLMGGDVTLESRLGEGSSFQLILPLPQTDPAPEAEGSAFTPVLDRPLRTLVVDDNTTNQEVARALLSALGVSVVTASSGLEGLAALDQDEFDLVFMDIHMPGMSGIEALAAIRASGRTDLPVLALTADAMAGERERLLGLGFDGYLSKPIDPAALVRALGVEA